MDIVCDPPPVEKKKKARKARTLQVTQTLPHHLPSPFATFPPSFLPSLPPSFPSLPTYLRGRDSTKGNFCKALRRVRTVTNPSNYQGAPTQGNGAVTAIKNKAHDIFLGHLGELLLEEGRQAGREGGRERGREGGREGGRKGG